MKMRAVAALPFKAGHALLSILVSPWGYARELAALGFAIWLTSVAVSTAAKSWSPADDAELAQAQKRPAIVRILQNPHAGLTCLFQDFSRIVAIDDETGDVFFSHEVTGAHRYEFGCDPDGWAFLLYCGDDRLEWWHSTFGPIELIPAEDVDKLKDVTLSRSGRVVCGMYENGSAATWRLSDSGEILQSHGTLPRRVDRITLSPDGEKLAVKSKSNQIAFHRAIDAVPFSEPIDLKSLIMCSTWSADSAWFAAGLERGQVQVMRADDVGHTPRIIDLDSLPTALVLSADGRWLVAATSCGMLEGWCDGERIWSVSSYPSIVRTMDISADDQRVIAGGGDGRILTYDSQTGALLQTKSIQRIE